MAVFQEATRMTPSFDGAVAWLNSRPLTTLDLLGKVVAVQFWTYTCVNWSRTLPYVRAWARKYRDSGLVIVGAHTPEFSFERNLDNIKLALRTMDISYPVAVDNNYAIWNAFANQYWPALYVIDGHGKIAHHHFGEGGYDESERALQRLLAEAGATHVPSGLVTVAPHGLEVAADWAEVRSAETYLGSERTQGYVRNASLLLNEWTVSGDWSFGKESIALQHPGGRLRYRFHARDVNLIMSPRPPDTRVRFRVSLDEHQPGAARGEDIDASGDGVLAEQRTYQLIRQPKPIADRTVEIEFLDAGAEAFDFTFG